MSLADFLTENNLQQYIQLFIDQGITDITDLLDLPPNTIDSITQSVNMLKGHSIKFKRKLEEYKKAPTKPPVIQAEVIQQIPEQTPPQVANIQENSDQMQIDEVEEVNSEEMEYLKEMARNGTLKKKLEAIKGGLEEIEKLKEGVLKLKNDILGMQVDRFNGMLRELEGLKGRIMEVQR